MVQTRVSMDPETTDLDSNAQADPAADKSNEDSKEKTPVEEETKDDAAVLPPADSDKDKDGNAEETCEDECNGENKADNEDDKSQAKEEVGFPKKPTPVYDQEQLIKKESESN